METFLSSLRSNPHSIEPLEQRIAPAALTGRFAGASTGSPIRLDADASTTSIPAGLSTSESGGAYLLYVEKGSCLVYTTDLNGNNRVDFNEITGISAGPGLRLISFVDIHGDIVTNLNPDFTLTDSNGDASDGRDGRVLLPNKIEKITLRSVTQDDLPKSQNPSDRLALSNYSIFGNIYAGGGFGVAGGGLLIDATGKTLQSAKFSGGFAGGVRFVDAVPEIGGIYAGSAAVGKAFSFGTAFPGSGLGFNGLNIRGNLQAVPAAAGTPGADIIGVKAAEDSMLFNLGTLQAGNGGEGGRGGDVTDVRITGDQAGGYRIIAGDAGNGAEGARGGNVTRFADLGSITGSILIQSGRGGNSLLGAGGAGGSINFDPAAPQNMVGRIRFVLGDGGNGLTNGGNGGSQPKASIEIQESQSYPLALVSSRHDRGRIGVANGAGALNGVDFDQDGENDMVFTSANPNQLVVKFGAPFSVEPIVGFDEAKTQFLNGPGNATGLTVADFNNDGLLDIATASGNASSAGVYVYLATRDPLTTRFSGFADPTINPLPAYNGTAGLSEQNVPIASLAAGDFDGDGDMDIAAFSTQTTFGGENRQGISYLFNDGQLNGTVMTGSGYFYGDLIVLAPRAPTIGIGSVMKATALSGFTGVGRDVLLSASRGGDSFFVLDLNFGEVTTTRVRLGKVDTNRQLNTLVPPDQEALQEATLQDFAVVDVNQDGNADVIAVTKEPLGYLVTFQGDGEGGFTTNSRRPVGAFNPTGDDNSGIKIVGATIEGGLGLLIDSIQGLLPSANPGTDRLDQVTLVTYSVRGDGSIGNPPFVELDLAPTLDSAALGQLQAYPGDLVMEGSDSSLFAYDIYRRTTGGWGVNNYLLAYPLKDRGEAGYNVISEFGIFGVGGAGYVATEIMEYSLFFSAGNGGHGLTGKGGAGGTIGDTLKITKGVATGDFNVVLPADTYEVRLAGGRGGNGFLDAGRGGSVKGVSVSFAEDVSALSGTVSLFAGAGGDSASATGGAGGELAGFSVMRGVFFSGGAGGRGYVGGAGGAVRGDAFPDFVAVNGNVFQQSNVDASVVRVFGGQGGGGQKTGGAGGSVIKLKARFLAQAGGGGGILDYRAGDGGSAVAGQGGAGGSLLSVSPALDANNLAGTIHLQAGAGGAGGTGGAGGSVNDFTNSPTGGQTPTVLSVLAGSGGRGISGNGGLGGSVSNIKATALGVGQRDVFNSDGLYLRTDDLVYNRVVAGNGGDSVGGVGGKGGSISALTSGATSSSFAVAAGRGGDGLASGGEGGGVKSASVNIGGGNSKFLVIAGDGGDAYAGLPTGVTPLAFGSRDGLAGNGGSIEDVSQPGSINTRVDLIAGNGGNTPNWGITASLTSGVGNGGSVKNVSISGDIGNVDSTTAIRAYNNVLLNQRISDFVATQILGDPATVLSDALGNVGIVVGSNGRVRDSAGDGNDVLDPSTAKSSGSLINVSARNIMSAVAGSVDRINAIANVSNLTTTIGSAIYGADKGAVGLGYFSSNGALLSGLNAAPEIGGRLLDGAIVRANATPAKQKERDFILG